MHILIAEVCIWLVLWAILGLGFGIYSGGHGWQLIPLIGVIYGLVAGSIYSLLSKLYRAKRGQLNLLIASMLGLAASICTIPFLVILTVELKAASLFVLVAGSLSGIVVYRFVRKKYDFEVNT